VRPRPSGMPGVAFSRGRTVPYEDGMDALDKLSSDEIDEMMWAGVSVMVADEVFVEKRIAYLDGDPAVSNPFRNRLDLSHVGVVGHSMGGQAAITGLPRIRRIQSVCMPGWTQPIFYLRPTPSRKPFLLLMNSTWGTSIISQSLAQRYLAAWAAPEVFFIRGTKHNSFDDLPLLDPEERAKALSDPIKAHSVIAAIVVEFFEGHFGHGKATPLDSDVLQDVMAVDLRKIAGKAPALGSNPPK
jgi:hypothetical protein